MESDEIHASQEHRISEELKAAMDAIPSAADSGRDTKSPQGKLFEKLFRRKPRRPQSQKERDHRLQCLALWVQIALFVATVAAFYEARRYADIAEKQQGAMIGQWMMMVSQWGTMRDALVESQQQTFSAQRGSLAAKESADTAAKQMELDQRSWVFPSGVFADKATPPAVGTVFRIVYKNSGRSPAIHVRTILTGFPSIALIPPVDPGPDPASNSDIVASQQEDSISTSHAPSNDAFIQRIRSGKEQLFLEGTVWYDDIFLEHHWTQFCYRVTDVLLFAPCPIHNSCDTCEKQKQTH